MKNFSFRLFSNFTAISTVILLLSIFPANGSLQQKNNLNIPVGFTKEQILNFIDENGNKIIPQEDSTDAFQTRNFTGLNAGDSYAFSVGSAGDVNGDGYDDIIIGAPYNDGTASNAGRAYIYFGGLNVNTLADVTLSGETANSYFGYSVSKAGDVNGDGYSDVVVGAWAYSTNTGRAYIYFGGAVMNITVDVIMTGDSTGVSFGISVSAAGDVNGDGYDDVIVGASQYSNKGKAFIYFGGSVMNNTADIVMGGEGTSNLFGISVSTAGDVNNDGFADVIVGASGYSSSTGRAYVYFGGASMNNAADVTMTGETTGSNFGYSVSIAGELNGDGYCDVIVGSNSYGSNNGRAYIYYGGIAMNNISDVIMDGETGSWFGRSVSTAGDMNGDGYDDVIVGAYQYSSATGRAYVYYGGTEMNSVSDFKITGEAVNDYFGNSVVSAGDVNGDGYPDVIIGAYGNNSSTGKAYLYMYGMSGTLHYDLTLTGETGGNSFGHSVASAGDVNGDGYSDLIAGAPGYSTNTGRAYIFFGGASMNNTADVTFTGEATSNYFGFSVSSAGDVNGDGYGDVIVGAYGYSSGRGKVYIYFGGASMNNVVDVSMIGETSANWFGLSVSSAGDFNSDGYSDVIAGAPYINSNTGKAYLYYGGASMNNAADLTFAGETTSNNFGWAVATAGDANGDGINDIIIGAPSYNSATGRVYLYYGSTSPEINADVIMTGESTGFYFGYSVSTAGDFNGDGYSDLLVGSYEMGRAYIFFGGISMNNTYDVSMTGEGGSCVGYSVSSAGDFNGDGFSDVIISCPYIPVNGKAYIYFGGGPGLNNNPDIILSEPTLFGQSVSTAGDLNGDGSVDLIVGASGYSGNTGRCYVYFTSSPDVHPDVLSVKDVPDDQGGFVKVKWTRSGYDIPVYGIVSTYLIERSSLAGMEDIIWIPVGTVPATRHPVYEFEARTPTDSGDRNYNFSYKVTAISEDPQVFWGSNIVTGYSVDNLAPLPPVNLAGVLVLNKVQLTWNANPENDLRQYIIYRDGIQKGTSKTLAFIDSTIKPDSTYKYRISAEDIHGNISQQSDSVVITYIVSTINIKVIQEGYYNSVNDNLNIKDTVRAYLHNNSTPYNVIDSAFSVIDSVSFTGAFRFYDASYGTYYIAIKHRNSIETWSKSGGEIFTSGTIMNFDFTNASSQAYGNNMIQVSITPLRYGTYSGDVNQDGVVDGTDGVLIDNDAALFNTGYLATDLNGDDVIDGSDALIADNNAANYVSAVVP